MSKLPILFSIVIPTYNCLPFLKKAIKSVLLQTEQNFEILIIDNSSDDGTKEYLRDLDDSRIHSFEVQNYGVIAFSRNTGIKKAKGSWVCFLDADDIWYKEKLTICKEYINDEVDVIYHDLLKYGKVNFLERKILSGRKLYTPVLIDLLVNGNAIINSSAVVRRNMIEQVNYLDESEDIVAAEDFNIWLKIAEKSENFLYINDVLGEYYIGEENVSNKNMSLCSISASNDFIKYLNKQQLNKYEAWIAYTSGRYNYLNKNYNSSIKYLFKSLKGSSTRLRIRSLFMLILIYFNKVKNIF